jgi:DNA-binding MarR family transcriptional regulator
VIEVTGIQRRSRQLDDIAEALPRRANQLARLFVKRSSLNLSRTEIGVLGATTERPQRITDLAAAEGVTQPAITLLVNRLQDRGWLSRQPDPEDGRAVLVTATAAGKSAFNHVRAEYRAFFHEEMASLEDEEISTLARAIDILDKLVERLSEGE